MFECDGRFGVGLPDEVLNTAAQQIGPPREAGKVITAKRLAGEQLDNSRGRDSRQVSVGVDLVLR